MPKPQPPAPPARPVPAALSAVRAAAGRSGGLARWANIDREPTVKIRVYASDAARIKSMPGTSAQAVHTLLTAHPKI